jgi:hypothetical protein
MYARAEAMKESRRQSHPRWAVLRLRLHLLLLLLLSCTLLLPLLLLLLLLLPAGLQHGGVSRRPHNVAAGQHGPPGQAMLLPRHCAKAALRWFPHQQAGGDPRHHTGPGHARLRRRHAPIDQASGPFLDGCQHLHWD